MNDFFKNLNIIYFDKNEKAIKYFSNKIQSYIPNLYFVKNINEMVNSYDNLIQKGLVADAVICNTNSIKQDAIEEAVREIREINPSIPFILMINNDKIQLLENIKLNVTGYISKTLNVEKLLKKLEICCSFYHKNDSILKKKEELENYLKLIDKVAIIVRTNSKGKLIQANDMYYQISQDSPDDLNSKTLNLHRKLDISKDIYLSIKQKMQQGLEWDGVIKSKTKNESICYVNITIIPIVNNGKIDEYISVGFIVTQEELNKKDFRKKVMNTIQAFRSKENKYVDVINSLEKKIENFTTAKPQDEHFQIKLENYTYINQKLKGQISYYEDTIKQISQKHEKYIKLANEKMNSHYKTNKNLKEENNKLKIYLEKSLGSCNEKIQEISKLQDRVSSQSREISNLRDVIEHLEEKYETKTSHSFL